MRSTNKPTRRRWSAASEHHAPSEARAARPGNRYSYYGSTSRSPSYLHTYTATWLYAHGPRSPSEARAVALYESRRYSRGTTAPACIDSNCRHFRSPAGVH